MPSKGPGPCPRKLRVWALCTDGRSDCNLTFSFQDMFDPHGWSEDSYYEALGNLLALCIYSSTHPSVCPSRLQPSRVPSHSKPPCSSVHATPASPKVETPSCLHSTAAGICWKGKWGCHSPYVRAYIPRPRKGHNSFRKYQLLYKL